MTAVEDAAPDVEFCHPTEGPVWAYCGKRAASRNSIDGERRHAVSAWSRLGGALDAECGKDTFVEVGPWDPTDPHNCPECVKFLAGEMPMPPDPQPAPAPAPSPPAPVRVPMPRRRSLRPGPGQLATLGEDTELLGDVA